MTGTLELPTWLVILAGLLALIAALDKLLIPGLRWLLRRRVNRAIEEVNRRLQLKIQPFKLTKRSVLIDRLVYDPEVLEAVEVEAATRGEPRAVVMKDVERYAREIVPSFNAYAYFRIGTALAKRITRLFYRVRVGYADNEALGAVPTEATVVFVMNHRSNMDYVIVPYLAATSSALSYAVGEWARVWPLETLVRSMGAYFVRRDSRNPIYRKVLSRYIHMATEGGVTQAVFPEGGLSRDGRLRPAKLGIFGYMLREFDPETSRDITFIPVGLNYDRVMEDRTLIRDLDPEATRRGALFATVTLLRFHFGNLVLAMRRRWYRLGYACVSFGTPISLRAYATENRLHFPSLEKNAFFDAVERFGQQVMQQVGAVVPVLPVSLVTTVMLEADEPLSEIAIKARTQDLIQRLEAAGAHVYIPRRNRDYAVTCGLRMLILRHLVAEEDGLFRAAANERRLLQYYANAIAHLPSQN
ncbi:MAG: 1-acyl-sn-glycerol-3-phosphate acyltransferase [Sphingomonadales bacterium]|nr:1-acyl-sn-glycerol-3-phosphate acyltransferase [Sphingomonadales bacterium]